MKTKLHYYFIILAVLVGVHHAAAQSTTAFTYQGQLHDGGTNVNGAYTMIYKLYDSVSSGNQIGSAITNRPTLANGLFTVNLDFGAGAFNGNARWLGITITNGGVTQTLSPRVQVLPVPYALYAASANVAATATTATTASSATTATTATTANFVAANSITTVSLQDNAVTSAKIVSVSGSKVSGGVAFATNATFANGALSATSAASLTNGSWNTSVGSVLMYGVSYPNIFGLYNSNSLVLGMNYRGLLIPQNLHVSSYIYVGDSSSTIGYIYYTNTYGLVLGNAVSGYDATINGNLNVIGTVYQSSDRNLKDKFTPIDSQRILERVASLPISNWNFKTDTATRHIGPMAQDFYAAFNVGADDKHIAIVDEGGVALAAIQGLNEKLKEKDAELHKLQSQNESLENRLANLERLVKTSTPK